MNFILKPSLKHMAAVKLATVLWNQSDIKNAISTISNSWRERKEIERKVQEKLSVLSLPVHLMQEISAVIKVIGAQILGWIDSQHRLDFNLPVPQEFFWTSYGTIDKKRTGEMLVNDESIDIIMRYKLSCIFCLEDSIADLWSKLPEDSIKHLADQNEHVIFTFWTHTMRNSNMNKQPLVYLVNDFIDFNNRGSELFEAIYNSAWFVQCLLQKEPFHSADLVIFAEILFFRNALFSNILESKFIKVCYTEILGLILSKMNYSQQWQLFETDPVNMLTSLLEWPWHFLFKDGMKVLGSLLSPKLYKELFINIISKVENGQKYCNFQEVFGKTWQQSPDAVKRHILHRTDCFDSEVILRLFKIRDMKNIKLIFSDATLKEKKICMFSFNGLKICRELILSEEWNFLKDFIKEFITSKHEMLLFKEHVRDVIIGNWPKDVFDENLGKLYKCFLLLDEILSEFDKREIVEETSINEAKRLKNSD